MHPLTTATTAPSLRSVAQSIAGNDPARASLAVARLIPTVQALYDLDDTDFVAAWTAGNPADFLAATLYRDDAYVLRLHVHAPGAADCDLHTHKGIVRSTVLSGAMRHETATPVFGTAPTAGGLDVWQCGSPHGQHVMAKTPLVATIDPAGVLVDDVAPGDGFRVDPGEYHRVAASPDPRTPTVSLCLFEIDDACRPEPYVLTNRPTPTVAARAMTPAFARTAIRRILDGGPGYDLAR